MQRLVKVLQSLETLGRGRQLALRGELDSACIDTASMGGQGHSAALRNSAVDDSHWNGAQEKYTGQKEQPKLQVPAKYEGFHQQRHDLRPSSPAESLFLCLTFFCCYVGL